MKLSKIVFFPCLVLLLASGCASSSYLKGVTPDGRKVYLGPTPIENTPEFKTYQQSTRSEVDKQRYLFQRLKNATELVYFHDGAWYTPLEAYRGGMWLMRNRYEKGQDSRAFIRKWVERSEAGNVHLVKYPDGSVQSGADILYNELDLLEQTAAKQS
ncbi:MAG TPA: hypothetical protein VL688_06965 [Verrucomicrobiae bacterium]|nr:hypothetical protein [Verrucomicrobiae bacterium]